MVSSRIYRHRKTTGQMQATVTSQTKWTFIPLSISLEKYSVERWKEKQISRYGNVSDGFKNLLIIDC